ncbi:hypothetical protein BCU84_00265 [Shewanella sp. 10N.286.51.B7]|uniref:DUF3644 domain-containing protein n=1 Tax=Shewanella sp. 10N.286.51.B7 TaxID=1880836 RepID=UPI000C85E22C|nr:DUF3644 domain-containing protein [Shewanella sp. 10N.286.51.B7]PMG81091.1 hypothetical protein BCU84_00265 [Shewanella sp. 10N.286.51.B7]
MIKKDKRSDLLAFFRDKEKNQQQFTYVEAAKATGYKVHSISKFVSENLKGKFIFQNKRPHWYSQGLLSVSDDDFFRITSQSTQAKVLTDDDKLYNKLVKRSLNAFTVALEVYNRPSLENRIEAFAIMMTNAWELLLKSQILKTKGFDALFEEGGKSIPIGEAINFKYPLRSADKDNLNQLVSLRNDAVHLLLPEIQPQLSRLFQTTVLLYQEEFSHQEGYAPLSDQSVGMLSLVIDGPEPDMALLKEEYGKRTADEVVKFLSRFTNLEQKHNSNRFAINMEYKLALTKNPGAGDLTFGTGPDGTHTVFVDRPKNLNKTHPFHEKAAIDEINKKQSISSITNYSFRAVVKKHKIKSKAEFFDFTDRPRYTESYIEWFVKNLSQQNWLEKSLPKKKRKT